MADQQLSTSTERRLSIQSATSATATASASDEVASIETVETKPTETSIEASESPLPPLPKSPILQPESEKSFVENYSAEVVGCGYLRLSCQIIDRYIKFGSWDDTVPTKVEVDAKYVKMLEAMVQKQIREIISGTEKNASKVFLNGLMRARDEALKEKDSEDALRVWEGFEKWCSGSSSGGVSLRSVSNATSLRSRSSTGGSLRASSIASSTRSVSYVGSSRSIPNISKDETVMEEQRDFETSRNDIPYPVVKSNRKPKEMERLLVPRRRTSSLKKSPLSIVKQAEDL